jgi:hypothetical protein
MLGFLLTVISCAVASPPCASHEPHDLREVLDCTVSLKQRGNPDDACRLFVSACEGFKNGTFERPSPSDIERFFFEGGDLLLTYAKNAQTAAGRLSAAGDAETFFTLYIDWLTSLSEDEVKKLPNLGRIRSVTRHLGNAFIAEDRKSDIHNCYWNLYVSKGAGVFGYQAVLLWEQSLRDIYGPPSATKNSPQTNAQWIEFGRFLGDWANVEGMLPTSQKEYYRGRSEQILGKLL